jgi:uncharacterized Zn finger protein
MYEQFFYVNMDINMKLNRRDLVCYIDEPYFSRGEEYVQQRLVKISSMSDTWIKGKIVGTNVYAVKLEYKHNELSGICSCPAFEQFGPCKHLAALGLALLAYHCGKYQDVDKKLEGDIEEYESFEKSLKRKNKSELIEMLIQVSNWYPDIVYDLMD